MWFIHLFISVKIHVNNNYYMRTRIRHNYPSLIQCLRAFHILCFAYLLYRCYCYNYYKTAIVTFVTVTITIILLCY